MYLCKYNLSKECKGTHKDCVNCILEDIKFELWMEGVNMGGEYQGVWVRFKDIEKAIDNHISGKEKE